MATLSDLGLAPEEHGERRSRHRRVSDESGARPLPTEAYEPYDVDPLDEEVELPGVSRPQAGTFFGIGIGLGIAVLAVVAGLYLGGYVGRPALAAGPEPAAIEPDPSLFEEAQNAEALALARIALMPRLLTPTTATESPDIQVIDQTPAPALAEPQDTAPAPPSPAPKNLSNELDELEQSLPPRGPVAPKEPTTDQAPPQSAPLPAPAQPTAPAETSAPDTIPAPADRNPN